MTEPRIAVIGAGSWGTGVSALLSGKGLPVCLWAWEPEVAEGIRRDHRNPLFLTDSPLPHALDSTSDLAEALAGAEVAVMGVPSRWVGEMARRVAETWQQPGCVINLAKGFEGGSGRRLSEVIAGEFAARGLDVPVAALSGPNHAEEVVRQVPSATVIASRDPQVSRRLQALFNTPYFRVYTSSDIIGVECGAAYKNIVAIAAGVLDGLGLGDNTKATLVTRGLAEMTRFGCRLGARPSTFSGLSGVGDLIVTCFSRHSRNRGFGEAVARGESPGALQETSRMVVEGVHAANAVMEQAGALGVDLPVARAVYEVIRGKAPDEALRELMGRGLKDEVEEELYEDYYASAPNPCDDPSA
jgi:glycerol-3-phosphate dehydrogenase (NAD(P)+)